MCPEEGVGVVAGASRGRDRGVGAGRGGARRAANGGAGGGGGAEPSIFDKRIICRRNRDAARERGGGLYRIIQYCRSTSCVTRFSALDVSCTRGADDSHRDAENRSSPYPRAV